MKLSGSRTLKRKILIVIALLVSVVCVFLFYMYSPTARELRVISKRINELDEKLQTLHHSSQFADREMIEKLRDMVAKYEELKRYYDSVVNPVQTESELGTLIGEIVDIARTSGSEVVRISSRDTRVRGNYREIPLEITLRCSFRSLEEFVKGVELMDRLVKISLFQIKSEETMPPVINADFVVTCCVRGDEYAKR